MDFGNLISACIISIGCIATAAFLLGLLFVDVTDNGWRIKVPWLR